MPYRLIVEDLSHCPYYMDRTKQCASGCWDEPKCTNNEPEGGWPEVEEFETQDEVIHYLGVEAYNNMKSFGYLAEPGEDFDEATS